MHAFIGSNVFYRVKHQYTYAQSLRWKCGERKLKLLLFYTSVVGLKKEKKTGRKTWWTSAAYKRQGPTMPLPLQQVKHSLSIPPATSRRFAAAHG